jgi:hypothetical protein
MSGHVGFVMDKVALAQVLPSTSVFLANTHSTDCSTFINIIIYHPGLVQQATKLAKYQVGSVSHYPQKLKKKKPNRHKRKYYQKSKGWGAFVCSYLLSSTVACILYSGGF